MRKRLTSAAAILGVVLLFAIMAMGTLAAFDAGPFVENGAVIEVAADVVMAPAEASAFVLLPSEPAALQWNWNRTSYIAVAYVLGMAILGYIVMAAQRQRTHGQSRTTSSSTVRFHRRCIRSG